MTSAVKVEPLRMYVNSSIGCLLFNGGSETIQFKYKSFPQNSVVQSKLVFKSMIKVKFLIKFILSLIAIFAFQIRKIAPLAGIENLLAPDN